VVVHVLLVFLLVDPLFLSIGLVLHAVLEGYRYITVNSYVTNLKILSLSLSNAFEASETPRFIVKT